jgi:outer membrane biosynthesis protein TonB
MLRRKLRLRMDDLKELRVKLVPTWCTSRRHMAKAKLSRIRITTSQRKLLPLRRRRRRRRRREEKEEEEEEEEEKQKVKKQKERK